MAKWLGIDPGKSGALAVIDGSRIFLHDAPVVQVKVGKVFKNQLDPAACTLLLQKYQSGDMMLVIEKVQPMPSFKVQRKGEEPSEQSMGVTSAFNFGRDYGMWIGVVAALGIPYHLVAPQSWKKRLMADMSKDKDAGRIRAMQLYPQAALDLQRKKDHGRADALLLARFGQMMFSPGGAPPMPEPVAETLF